MTTALAAASLIFAQQSATKIEAEYDTGWELEYPALIGGFVDDYKLCLRSGSYVIGDGLGFESQYRADVVRCAERAEKLEAESNALLARRDKTTETPPATVADVFETLRRIHVERGAGLDRVSGATVITAEERQEILADAKTAECVASIETLREKRQDYAKSAAPRIRAIHAKDEYSEDDRRALLTYRTELGRLTGAMMLELDACPAAAYVMNEINSSSPAS
ncbi:hypothetical protein [Erythrobacter sp. SD-21]|uniref:hypothetical protein n=1 Tax=Erythrobacter sp. SD-21 TaxID=161528 RepID=UPI000153FE24|nr:hypothetical protein [Erythrobacter sp. SD-21]EDL49761.1 hypothetical protein ED21_19222 [Erythrobacter sp. SD-21]